MRYIDHHHKILKPCVPVCLSVSNGSGMSRGLVMGASGVWPWGDTRHMPDLLDFDLVVILYPL